MVNLATTTKRMISIAVSTLFFCLGTACAVSFAQGVESIPSYVTTPAQLSQWLTADFKYETEMPDYWQPAEETIDLKKGDCEDFAILAQAALEQLNIPSQIVVINFKDLPNQAHAVCVFKTGDFYNFITNQQLIQTNASTISAAIQGQYPDWEKITFTNAKKENLRKEFNTAGLSK